MQAGALLHRLPHARRAQPTARAAKGGFGPPSNRPKRKEKIEDIPQEYQDFVTGGDLQFENERSEEQERDFNMPQLQEFPEAVANQILARVLVVAFVPFLVSFLTVPVVVILQVSFVVYAWGWARWCVWVRNSNAAVALKFATLCQTTWQFMSMGCMWLPKLPNNPLQGCIFTGNVPTVLQKKGFDIPIEIAGTVNTSLVVMSLLGVTYGILSASWDAKRKGSFLGFTEFQANLPVFLDRLRGYGKKRNL